MHSVDEILPPPKLLVLGLRYVWGSKASDASFIASPVMPSRRDRDRTARASDVDRLDRRVFRRLLVWSLHPSIVVNEEDDGRYVLGCVGDHRHERRDGARGADPEPDDGPRLALRDCWVRAHSILTTRQTLRHTGFCISSSWPCWSFGSPLRLSRVDFAR